MDEISSNGKSNVECGTGCDTVILNKSNEFTVDYEENESVTLTIHNDIHVIGTLNYIIRNNIIYINEMDIRDEYQNKGYGRKLVTFFTQHTRDLKMIAVELTAAEDAYGFWEKVGFKHVKFNHQLVYKYVMRLEL